MSLAPAGMAFETAPISANAGGFVVPSKQGFAGDFSSARELIRYGTLVIGSGEALLIRSGVHGRCSPSSINLI